MAVTAAMVKELRQATDAPMMDCKKALTECDGDFDKASEWLRERGVAKSAKKADRVAAEGSIGLKISPDFKRATLVEVNSETDFVAQNDGFKDLVSKTVAQAFETDAETTEALRETELEGKAFSAYFDETVAKIGEKIEVRRIAALSGNENVAVNGYVHSNTRIGVIVAIECDSAKTAEAMVPVAKQVAMHASAMKPTTLSYKDFDPDFVAAETAGRIEAIKTENEERARMKKPLLNVPSYISMCQLTDDVLAQAEADIKAALKEQGKPEQIWDKIVPGQLARFIDDNTTLDKEQALLDQKYVLDDKLSVAEAVAAAGKAAGGTAEISAFIRLEVGEGLEKKVDDFAAEVAAQMA
ncbi:translation elongation factor Ts [Sulfurimonas sp. HSL3-7]|uniref:translation elongation factor Ts n=1 Tax=Sulfonitrofixus jiaomeiensis TaxID=3131938 RepID=UPI0031F7D52E